MERDLAYLQPLQPKGVALLGYNRLLLINDTAICAVPKKSNRELCLGYEIGKHAYSRLGESLAEGARDRLPAMLGRIVTPLARCYEHHHARRGGWQTRLQSTHEPLRPTTAD